jgi:hypothetical protein
MTQAEVLAQYRPIRAGICRVLREATKACSRADLNRAVKQVAPWAEAAEFEEADTAEMLVDVALFEPNQRGRRAFDRFLAERAERLTATDRALAERMAGAWFSIFRVAGRHEVAGLWLEDMLAGDRRLWLVDEALEASAPEGAVAGMRLFDAGPVPRRLRHHRRARRRDARFLPRGEGARRALAVPPLPRRHALRRPTPSRRTARTRRSRPAADPGRDPHYRAERACESRADAPRPPIAKAAQGIKAPQEVIGIGTY